ncbi:MAG: phospholipid methyltransferase [Planctomycetota bacterium]|nr:MAG: phospholipid methyltransferase [Planctomycetota bacterium]
MASRANYRLFWQEFRRTFHSTGAVLPSGSRLCRALTRYVAGDGLPRRVLEVGPGTGVVTDQIILQMGARDTLDLVEVNDRFVAALRDRLEHDPRWQSVADRVAIHHLPVEQLSTDRPFDAIVSCLPFNNFPAELVRSILAHLEGLAAEDATLSFFEYIGVRKAKALVASREERRRLEGITQVLADLLRQHALRRDCVLANIPPAWVHHVKFATQHPTPNTQHPTPDT